MAYEEALKMSIQDKSGKYYSAILNSDNTWSVSLSPTLSYLSCLPDGWNDTSVTWERDNSYLGVIRSQTNSNFLFSKDGRAIIQSIRSAQGIQGYGLLTIYIQNFGTSLTYDIFYQSELDFKTYQDLFAQRKLSIGTLDSGLIRALHAYGDTTYNIPIWFNAGTPSAPAWEQYNHNVWVLDDGIKLLYNATYRSAATPTKPIDYRPNTYTRGEGILGFNLGQHGTVPNDGYHTIPSMAQYNITQNNGATTFIGNDILQPLLKQGDQGPGASAIVNEENFSGVNNSQPYTRENYSLKNACVFPPDTFQLFAAVSGTMESITDSVTGLPCNVTMAGATSHAVNSYLSFVLFEIDELDNPTPGGTSPLWIAGQYSYIPILTIPTGTGSGFTLPSGNGTFSNYTTPTQITINLNKAYVFGIIFDSPTGQSGASSCGFVLDALQFSLFSNYDYGTSGVPIPAPQLNPSVYAAYRLHQLLEMLVPFMATTNSDLYGFPIPITTDFNGSSAYLSNPSLPPVGDGIPYQTVVTSAYCLHDLEGQSYVSLSFNQLFDFCKKVWGCGVGIIGDSLTMENLAYYFNNSVKILDLGFDVSDLEIIQETIGVGANLKLGYTKADTNSDFGVDSFCTELFFNTPASSVPQILDFEETSIGTDQYPKEKARAQRVNQPVGTVFDPANPSSDNQPYALYCTPAPTTILPSLPLYPFTIVDPSGVEVGVNAHSVEMYNGTLAPAAQSSDPTAASAPYIKGLYYPDTAQNIKLSPCRALQRDTGRLLHSVLDMMDADSLSFRATGVMQYNNEALALAGMESNLQVGASAAVITEMKDITIGNLPPQLFKPIIIKVKSKYPINLYQILNTNPYGYVSFKWENEGIGYKEYKFFIKKATQVAATGMATEFEGWATPDMVI